MDNVQVMKKYATATMAAVLIFGAVAAGLIGVPQTAYAAVTMEASTDTFYGPGFVRVLITDTLQDEAGDTISPTIDIEGDEFIIDDIEAIGSSGTFELFITTSDTPLVPSNPTYDDDPGSGEPGPFVVRVFDGAVDGTTDETVAVDVNGDLTDLGSNDYGIDIDLESGDTITVSYGGQEVDIDFDDTSANVMTDRSQAGTGNEILVQLDDQDANSDPTVRDEFEFGTPADLLSSTETLDQDDPVWLETGINTGIFELTVVVGDIVADADNDLDDTDIPTGNTFTVQDHSVYEDLDTVTGADVVIDTDFDGLAPIEESSTDSVSVTLRNSDAAVELLADPSTTNGLQVQLTDADRNITTEDDDSITVADGFITIFVDFNGDGVVDVGEEEEFAFTETGDNTGIFLPDYDDDKIIIQFGATNTLDGDAGTITLDVDTIDEDIELTFDDPAFQSNDEASLTTDVETVLGEISAEETTVGITDDAEITLTDADLNTDPNTIETYSVGATFEFESGPDGDEEVVGTLEVLAAGEDLAAGDIDATFIETGPNTGIFVADDIDMGDIDAALADGLEDGDEIEFTYNDEVEDDDSDVTINVGIPDAGIDVDNSTVPIPGAALATGTHINLSVIDPTANANPGSIDTVTIEEDDAVGTVTDIEAEDGDGDAIDVEDFTGIGGVITLTETGANTGIFEEEVTLFSGEDPADLQDVKVTFEYDGETVSVTYRSFDGTISAAPAVVGTGDEFVVTVSDQDGNKDPTEEDELEVTFETDEDTDAGPFILTLDETGEDTGVFTDTVEVGVDIVVADGGDFSTEITLTYVDEITSAGDEDEDRETTVHVATATGQLVVTPEMVGPGTEITLQLIDTDLNEDPNTSDDVDEADDVVEIDSSDGDQAGIGFEETGPNTGIFEATIQFEPRDPDVDGAITIDGADEFTYTALPGDIIAFRYEDEESAGGGSTVVSVTFEIGSEDPTMEAASPTVQIGGTIALTIEDFDANQDGDALDSVDVDITSDSDPVGFTLSALETGENTGIFTVNVSTGSDVVSGAITVGGGDDVFLEYNDEFPADYADRVDSVLDPSKDFVLVVPVGTSVSTDTSATTPEPVVPKDISGNELEEVSAGQQVVLATTVNNNRNTDLEYAAVIEVRDADGFTVSLQWATGTLPAGGENEIGLSWTPMEAGTYTVRTFVLSDVANPSALSLIEESTLTVS